MPPYLCFPLFLLLLLSLSLLVAINYTDSLTGWNKEIKHASIVSWCMHSSLLPNTDIEEILHPPVNSLNYTAACRQHQAGPPSHVPLSLPQEYARASFFLPKSFLHHF
jgi:hypothetical protein